MNQSKPYTLYGAKFSLYSGKARSYLNYKGIPYDEVLASLGIYKKIIIPKTGVKFIPVVKTPENEYIQDTTIIIDELEKAFPDNSVFPHTPKQLLVSKLFELYGDEWLLLPAMHYRWNKDNGDYIYACFGEIALPGWPKFVRKLVGKKIGSQFKGFVPLLGMSPETNPEIENWYENDFLVALDKHFSEHDYLLGSAASIGDFGLMGPLYAHLYLDPYPGELMRKIAPNVVKWIERMNQAPENEGGFITNDEIPETLVPILKRLFSEQWAFIKTTIDTAQEWAKSTDENKVPRMLGKKTFKIGTAEGTKAITSFTQWKAQRVLDTYKAFNEEDRLNVDAFLTDLGALEHMQIDIERLFYRRNNKLSLES